jgi:hypothetical protein
VRMKLSRRDACAGDATLAQFFAYEFLLRLARTAKALQPQIGPVFLKERQALQPHTGLGTWGGPSSNFRSRENGISRAQALPGDPNRFAINGLGLCTASVHREPAGVAMPVHSAYRAAAHPLADPMIR